MFKENLLFCIIIIASPYANLIAAGGFTLIKQTVLLSDNKIWAYT
jgi:hypothetical protein